MLCLHLIFSGFVKDGSKTGKKILKMETYQLEGNIQEGPFPVLAADHTVGPAYNSRWALCVLFAKTCIKI